MDKVKDQQDRVVVKAKMPTTEDSDNEFVDSLNDLVKQQNAALQNAESEILRLRAELYEYHVQVIQNQHKQLQALQDAQ